MTAVPRNDPMGNAPFDTLAYAKKLEARGIETKQAEAYVEVLAEILETGFPTKQNTNTAIEKLSNEISLFREYVYTEFAKLRQEMAIEFAKVRQEIAEVKSDIIKWVFGISFAQAALIISVLKFFH